MYPPSPAATSINIRVSDGNQDTEVHDEISWFPLEQPYGLLIDQSVASSIFPTPLLTFDFHPYLRAPDTGYTWSVLHD